MILRTVTAIAALNLIAAIFSTPCEASIVYTVDETIGGGSVVGTITTDGTIGALGSANFLSWNLTFDGLFGATFSTNESSSSVLVQGGDVSATATNIYFNYDGADNGYLLFQHNPFSGQTYWCNATIFDTCYQGASVVPAAVNDPSAQVESRTGMRTIASTSTQVPEPMTIALLLSAFAALAWGCRSRSRLPRW
jgi:hypothetical protein